MVQVVLSLRFLEYTIYYACNVETSANNNKQGCQKGITAAVSLFSWIISEHMARQWRECKTLSYSAVLDIAYTTFSPSRTPQSVKDNWISVYPCITNASLIVFTSASDTPLIVATMRLGDVSFTVAMLIQSIE